MTMATQQYVHIFRHNEAEHNRVGDFNMHDPLLTTRGIESAEKTFQRYRNFDKPTLVLMSPLQRCIQTALHAFHPEWNKIAAEFFKDNPPRFIAMPQLQEMGEFPCDTCHPLEFLKDKYGKEVEFPDKWFSKNDWLIKRGTEYADNEKLVAERAEVVRQYIKRLPDREVVVVTHGDFIQHLGNQWSGMVGIGTQFGRVEKGEVVTTVIHEMTLSRTQLRRQFPSWMPKDDTDSEDWDYFDE